jgi:hypothetical protein
MLSSWPKVPLQRHATNDRKGKEEILAATPHGGLLEGMRSCWCKLTITRWKLKPL